MNKVRNAKKGLYRSYYETSQGWGGVVASEEGVLEVELPFPGMTRNRLHNYLVGLYPDAITGNQLTKQAANLLERYFAGEKVEFNLQLDLSGNTEFQHVVYQVVAGIPYGEVRSYGAVAVAVNRPLAARGVGLAMARNPVPIIIPCHRVIGSSGALIGYSGSGGISSKKWLLALEQTNVGHNI